MISTRRQVRVTSVNVGHTMLLLLAVAQLSLSGCGAVTPSIESVRAADQFYAALSNGDYDSIVAMSSRELFADTPPNEFKSRLRESHQDFGPLLSRQQVSVFITYRDISGSVGTATSFEFFCEYRRAHTIEGLRVFEPKAGGGVEIENYRFEVRDKER